MEATVKLDEQVKKIGKAVEDSKPYWEARRAARHVSYCYYYPAFIASFCKADVFVTNYSFQ